MHEVISTNTRVECIATSPRTGNAERMCSFFFRKQKTSKKSAKDFKAVNVKIRGTRFRTLSRSDYEPNT